MLCVNGWESEDPFSVNSYESKFRKNDESGNIYESGKISSSVNLVSVLDLVSGEHSVVLKGGESSSPHGLVFVQGSIFFSDRKARKIKVLHRHTDSGEGEVNVFAENGVAQRKYGLANVASFGKPSSIVAEGNSLFVCDTGANAISLITSMKALHSVTKQFGQLYDAFGVHCDEKNLEAASVLPFVDNAVQFYRKCVHDIREFFELPHRRQVLRWIFRCTIKGTHFQCQQRHRLLMVSG